MARTSLIMRRLGGSMDHRKFPHARWLLLALAFVVAAPGALLAQAGVITGIVTERSSGAVLEGARVTIPGTTLGAATDARGTYTLRGITPGTVRIRAQYIGYE